jgi:hypothetical protein
LIVARGSERLCVDAELSGKLLGVDGIEVRHSELLNALAPQMDTLFASAPLLVRA